MPQLQTIDQFAEKIKAKYPAYKETDNKELVDKIVAKYPQYKEQIDFGPTPEELEEQEKEKKRQESLAAANEAVMNIAGVPSFLQGVTSSVQQSVMSLLHGPIKFAKSVAFTMDDDVEEQLKENPKAAGEIWDNYWNALDGWEETEEFIAAGTKGAELQREGKSASITGLINEGEYLDAAELTVEQTAAGAVSLIPTYFGPWGAAFLGFGAAGSAFDEDIHDEEKIEAAIDPETGELKESVLMGASLAKGGVEFASELVTAGILSRAKKMIAAGKSQKAVSDYVNHSLGGVYRRGFGEEFLAEGLADTGNKIVDELFYGTEHDSREVLRDFLDNGIIGGIIGGKVASVGYAGLNRTAKNAALQETKSDEQLEASEGRRQALKELDKSNKELEDKAKKGDLVSLVQLDQNNKQIKEIVNEEKQQNKEHEKIVDDLSPKEFKGLAKEKDTQRKLEKAKKKAEKDGKDPAQIDIIDNQIEESKVRENRIRTSKARNEASKQVVKDLETKNEEHRATLEDAAKPQTTADGKPKAKTKKQKLKEKQTREAIKENEKLIKQAKQEGKRADDYKPGQVEQVRKVKERKPRVEQSIKIAQDKGTSTPQRNKAFNQVLKDTDKEINTVKKRVRQKLGNKIDQGKLDATVRTEVARLINSHKEGAASFGSRVLDPRFANKIATEINKEQQTIKKQALPKDARDKLKQELRDIDQDVLDGVLDPEAAEIIKDDIRNEYGEGDPTVTGIEKTTEEGTQVSPEVEAAVREQSTPDPDAETDLIKKVLKGKTLTDLFKDVAGNRAQIYALMPKVRKGAFHGIFDAGTNPDPALWESVFDDRRMKSKLKKLIEKRIDEANKPLSTDKDAGSIRDGSIEFLEGDKKTVARFMPLLGKLKRAFPDTKIIISKAKIQERLIEGGRDPGIYDTIKGMYSSDGEVLLNPDLMDAETPIHEFGHIWAKAVKYQRPELYRRGVQLIKKSPFWTEIQEKSRDPKSVYYNYGRDQMLEEAMATAIGQRGEQIFNRKQDQSQWDSLRQQILDWVGQRLGINKVQDMGLLEFLDLAATEIVTGEQLIPLEDTGALKDSGILEHLEVPVGTTRDYTRSTPPVKEFDTHGTFKGHKIQQELQPALDKLMPGEWIAWTTGKYGNAVPDHKRNAKLDARIQAKVEGTRKWLESKGYQLKQDPVNPGTHIVSVDLREIAEFERGRKEAASQLKKDGSKKPGPRRPLLWFSEATDADIKEIERFEKERKEAASKIKRTGSKKPGFPRRPLLWFSQATPEGKNANDVIRKIKKNLARGLKRQGDYKKSKVTAPTRQVIEATKKSFDKVGDQLSFEQLQDLNNKLKELIAADFQAQRDSKNKIRDNVNEIIKDKSGIDPSEKVSREDVRQGNTGWAKLRRISLANILAPASNNDFYGLVNTLASKKNYEGDRNFIKDHLLDPLEDANIEWLRMKHDLRKNWNQNLKNIGRKTLVKKTGIAIKTGQRTATNLNVGQLVKLYNYMQDADPKLQKQLENTGVTPEIAKAITDYVNADPKVKAYADGIPAVYNRIANDVNNKIQQHGYPGFEVSGKYTPLTVDSKSQDSYNQELEKAIIGSPGMNLYSVMSGRLRQRQGGGQIDLTSSPQQDFENYLNGPPRTAAFLDFSKNASDFFGANQLKGIEAGFGKNHADAIRDSLFRIVSGRNQPNQLPDSVKRFDRFINRAVAGVMFFNVRSSVLQMISISNYLVDDPSAVFTGIAGPYSKALGKIKESAWFKERGLGKTDVALAELFDQGGKGIDYVLEKGYSLTKFGDKSAIIFGGAAYMSGKYVQYKKQGLDEQAAWDRAYKDFVSQSEEAQQSTRPERLGQQQTTRTGKAILAFANTPMQYNRKIAKSLQDISGYGLTHPKGIAAMRKIAYYGAAQNLAFNMLQQMTFGLIGLGDEEEKSSDVLNSIFNTILRGMGIYGALMAGVKDAIIAVHHKGLKGKGAVAEAALAVSPAIATKVRHLRTALGDRDPKMQSSLELSKGTYQIAAAAEFANIPADRVLKLIEQAGDIAARDLEDYQKLLRVLGWSRYNLDKQLGKASGEGIEALIGGGDEYY